jgi:predicted MFS family arabinose efflux permease
LLICLGGSFAGYALTIVALYLDSFPLLLVARIIAGFTAGNQPIAQAALVDESSNEQEKTRFMGYIIVAGSLGLLIGPVLGGALTDQNLLGRFASMQAPFYAAAVLVFVNIVLVLIFSHNGGFDRRRIEIRPTDVFLTLWHAAKRPAVLRLSLVFFCSQFAFNTYVVFLNDFLFNRFQFSTAQNSIVLVLFGIAMAAPGAFLVGPINQRFRKKTVVYATLLVMAIGLVTVMVNPIGMLSYAAALPFVLGFSINYPMMLSLFSASVDETQQGWVMGVTVALYTLGAAITSVVGGRLMAIDVTLPFLVALAAVFLAAGLVFALWRGDAFERMEQK